MHCPLTNSNFDSLNSPIEDNTMCPSDCDNCFYYRSFQFSLFESLLDSTLPDFDSL